MENVFFIAITDLSTVDIGSYSEDSDSTIFSNSSFWKAITKGKVELPKPKPLPNDPTVNMPYVLIGDETFGLPPNLMRPYGGKMLSMQKKVFNYRLCRVRRYVPSGFYQIHGEFFIGL